MCRAGEGFSRVFGDSVSIFEKFPMGRHGHGQRH
jgi:hypothetical protein